MSLNQQDLVLDSHSKCPIQGADGHDFPGPVVEAVPGIAAVVEDVFVDLKETGRKPVLWQELPNVFD